MKKVLIVDDEPLNREFLSKILHKECYVVLEASNGKEAMDILSKRRVDLIIMDLNMPIMNGYDAIKAIRKELKLESRILTISATGENDVEAYVKYIGANYHLSKPYTLTKLLEILDTIKAL